MTSISEKTHAKNLENLHIANTIVESVGVIFNPNNPIISAPELNAFETQFQTLMQAVNETLPAEQNAVGEQIAAFKQVPARVTKIMKAVRAQNLSPEFAAHLKTTVDRLRGARVSPKTPDNPETVTDESKKNNSSSQRSYAGIQEHLDLFEEQLKSDSGYNPNEAEYKTTNVSSWVADLRAKRNNALAAKAGTRNARVARDAFVYNKTTGLIPRMNALKAYFETILDKSDARLKQLKKLRFVDYSK